MIRWVLFYFLWAAASKAKLITGWGRWLLLAGYLLGVVVDGFLWIEIERFMDRRGSL